MTAKRAHIIVASSAMPSTDTLLIALADVCASRDSVRRVLEALEEDRHAQARATLKEQLRALDQAKQRLEDMLRESAAAASAE